MSVIKYFGKMGDECVSNLFSSYLWKEKGLDRLLDEEIGNKRYGIDLELLLIQYYVEGEFDPNGPEHPKVSNYSKKNKDIAVAISVTKSLFHNRDEFARREFIVDSTINAIKLVKDKLIKKKLDIDLDLLIADVKEISKKYLNYPQPYFRD